MTEDQDRAHFTMWCILASPLISGNDPRTQSAATTAILTNRLAIAVNQDKLGRQAVVVQGSNATASQVFAKPLADGSVAVALLNRVSATTTVAFDFAKLAPLSKASHQFEVLDLWQKGKSLGLKSSVTVTMTGTSAEFYKLVPERQTTMMDVDV